MFGYILNFYKHATAPSVLKGNIKDYLQKEKNIKEQGEMSRQTGQNGRPLIVYGEFDRMDVEQISDFSRFRDIDPYAKTWIGSRQTMLLYTLDEQDNNGLMHRLFGTNQDIGKLDDDYNFLIFTMLTLDPSQYETKEFKESLSRCKQNIDNLITHIRDKKRKGNFDFQYQVLGSFSSSELVVVWYSKQYAQVLQVTELLRNITDQNNQKPGKGNLCFASVYSIVTQIKRSKDKVTGDLSIIEGDAELFFSFQDGIRDEKTRRRAIQEIKKRIAKQADESYPEINLESIENKISEKSVVGEYDYLLSMPANYLCNPSHNPFRKGNALHWMEEENIRNFSKSFIQLYYQTDTGDDVSLASELRSEATEEGACTGQNSSDSFADIENKVTKGYLSESVDAIKTIIYRGQKNALLCAAPKKVEISSEAIFQYYKDWGLRSLIKVFIPESVGLCDTLDLLYSDYVNNCSNLTSETWAIDLSDQFQEMIDYIFYQLSTCCSREKEPLSNSEMFQHIRDISAIFIQMIYHIAQSRRTVFIVPSCHVRYMGQYDMILRAYYGLEKKLLKIGYGLKRNDYQPRLTPIFTIDVVPEIYTQIFKIYQHYPKNDEKDDGSLELSGIFRINMPLGAMVDFLRYSMTITHETAHFLTPKNRDKRNQVLGMMYFSDISAHFLRQKLRETDVFSSVQTARKRLFDLLTEKFMCMIYNSSEAREFYQEVVHLEKEEKDKQSGEIYYTWWEYRKKLTERIPKVLLTETKMQKIICKIIQEQRQEIEKLLQDTLNSPGFEDDCMPLTNEEKQEIKEKIIGNLQYSGKDIECNPIVFESLNGYNYFKKSEVLSAAYREACQDLVCIRMFGLKLEDYLVFCVRHLNDKLDDPSSLYSSEKIRIAMLCDYLLLSQSLSEKASKASDDVIEKTNKHVLAEQLQSLYEPYEKMLKNGLMTGNFDSKIEEFFRNIYIDYSAYLETYSDFRSLFFYQLQDSDLFDQLDQKNSYLAECYRRWKEAVLGDAKERENKIFQINIEMIQHFQVQEKLRDIKPAEKVTEKPFNLLEFKGKLGTSYCMPHSTGHGSYNNEYVITKSQSLIDIILEIRKKYVPYRDIGFDTLWYRGHESSGYFLYPSIYRVYVDAKKKSPGNKRTVAEYQRTLINQFLSEAKEHNEMVELYPLKQNNQQIEYLADMQHYQFATNLVDWTDEISTALYFAVSENKKQDSFSSAALYVFQPTLYNLLRSEIIKFFIEKHSCVSRKIKEKEESVQRLLNSTKWFETGLIPTMSTQFNQVATCFQDYVFGPVDTAWTKKCIQNPIGDRVPIYSAPPMLPIAVSIPKNNERIRAQSGSMLAFNLCEQPVKDSGSIDVMYPHMELMEIQKFYQNNKEFGDYLESKAEEEGWNRNSPLLKKIPFIHKLILQKPTYKDLQDFVIILNKYRGKIYPSLEVAGKEATRRISERMPML